MFHREALEEGYVKGELTYLGAIQVSHEQNPFFDPNGKYPIIGYQLFYRMDVTTCLPFERDFESKARIWVEPEEFPFVVNDHRLAHVILETALKISGKKS